MIVKCPFCNEEHLHNEDAVKIYPNTIYACLTENCGLKYIIVLDDDWGHRIKTMRAISEYWADSGDLALTGDGNVVFSKATQRETRKMLAKYP
jgi:hypothetical protein